MVFIRKTVVIIEFDLYRNDGTFLEHFRKEEEVEPIEYPDKRTAEILDGTLDEWAKKVAQLTALVAASQQVGVDVSEIPEYFMETTNVVGQTFNAQNVKGSYIPEETSETGPPTPPIPPPIVPPIPEFVVAEIARLEARKSRVSPSIQAVIQLEIDLLKRRYNIP